MTEEIAITFAQLSLAPAVCRAIDEVGYETPLADPGRDHPAAAGGPRRRRPGADRHRQDRRLRPADPVAASTRAEGAAGPGADARPASSRCRSPRRSQTLRPHICRASTCCRSTAARSTALQLRQLRRGVQVVVGTPGRVMDHLRRAPSTCRSSARWCSTRPTRCCAWASSRTSSGSSRTTPPERQTALFSATMPHGDPQDRPRVPQRPGGDPHPDQDLDRRRPSRSATGRSAACRSSTP